MKSQIKITVIGGGLSNFDDKYGSGGKGYIDWEVNFEMGKTPESTLEEPKFFGIKGISVSVPSQTISFKSYFYNEETDEEVEKEVEIKLEDVIINDDLGECTFSDFKLLPVELIISSTRCELYFC